MASVGAGIENRLIEIDRSGSHDIQKTSPQSFSFDAYLCATVNHKWHRFAKEERQAGRAHFAREGRTGRLRKPFRPPHTRAVLVQPEQDTPSPLLAESVGVWQERNRDLDRFVSPSELLEPGGLSRRLWQKVYDVAGAGHSLISLRVHAEVTA